MQAVAYAAGRASHARQAKGDDSKKRDTLVLQVGGFGVGLKTPHSKKLIFTNVEQQAETTAGFSENGRRRFFPCKSVTTTDVSSL